MRPCFNSMTSLPAGQRLLLPHPETLRETGSIWDSAETPLAFRRAKPDSSTAPWWLKHTVLLYEVWFWSLLRIFQYFIKWSCLWCLFDLKWRFSAVSLAFLTLLVVGWHYRWIGSHYLLPDWSQICSSRGWTPLTLLNAQSLPSLRHVGLSAA